MGYNFTQWDDESGHLVAGQIIRASSSDNKVWGEENKTDDDLLCGTFVAVNADGGIKKITAATDVIHGIIVRSVYGDTAKKERHTDVGHFSHGDCVGALYVEGITVNRGDKIYIVATGDDAGKVTNVADGALDLGYWAEEVSAGNNCVAITLGYVQQAGGQ